MDMKRQICVYDHLVHEILERLPIKALVRFKSVCKPWNKMIQHPYLALMKLRRPTDQNIDRPRYLNVYYSEGGIEKFTAIIIDESIEIATPSDQCHRFECDCNGLYLFYRLGSHHLPLSLFNPVTQETLELPPHPSSAHSDIKHMEEDIVHGLGFDAGNGMFKVIRLTMDLDNVCRRPEILILGHKSWKQLDLPECLQGVPRRCSTIFVNGAIHWLSRRPAASRDHQIIVAFDVMKEEFRSIEFANFISQDYSLINAGGSLAVRVNIGCCIDILLPLNYDKGEWLCAEVEEKINRGRENYMFAEACGMEMIFSNGGSYHFSYAGRQIAIENLVQMPYSRMFIVDVPRYQLSLVPLSQYMTN